MRICYPIVLLALLVLGDPAWSKSQEERLKAIEERLLDVEADIAIIRKHTDALITRATLGYLNAAYFKAGLALVFPRDTSFLSPTDTGLGAFVGAGKYFGENHLVDAAFEWDYFPSLSLRYSFELHFDNPTLSVGPIVGVKFKLFKADPFDQFIQDPSEVRTIMFIVGMGLGFPLGRSMLAFELAGAIREDQFTLFSFAGVRFFL